VAREALEETGRAFVPSASSASTWRAPAPAGGDDVTWMRFSFAGTVGEPEPAARSTLASSARSG
jgi:hypothetical protein